MSRRSTFSELAFAGDMQDPNLPVEWARGVAIQILNWMWQAFDRLRIGVLWRVDLTQPLDQLERDLTRNHFMELQAVFQIATAGYASFYPEREWDEMETLSSSQAKPPAYDFAFVHYEHRRWAWPIEAKVLLTPATLHAYMGDVREKFEAGVAAPIVGEGGMIAYLLSDTADAVFENLQTQLGQTLAIVPEFTDRPHRVSNHPRVSYPPLRLHHMMMVCGP
jgi:hypothetical protein